jgi:hypothetical protein
VEGLHLGPPFAQDDGWLGFLIASTCPCADAYPHFVRTDVARVNGAPLGEGLSDGHSFHAQEALSTPGASRRMRHNRRD